MAKFVKLGDSHYNMEMVAKVRVIRNPDGDGKGGHLRVHWRDGSFEDVTDPEVFRQVVGEVNGDGKTDY